MNRKVSFGGLWNIWSIDRERCGAPATGLDAILHANGVLGFSVLIQLGETPEGFHYVPTNGWKQMWKLS